MTGETAVRLFGGDGTDVEVRLADAEGVTLRRGDPETGGLEESDPDCAVCVAGSVAPFELLGRVRERAPGLPFLVVSPDHDPELAAEASRSDRVEYLPGELDENGALPARVRRLADEGSRVRTHKRALVRLQEILAGDPGFDDSVDRLLSLGCEYLDTDVAFLSAIDAEEGRFDVEYAVGEHDRITPGATDSLSNTYCRRTMDGEGLLGVADATVDEGWTGDPAFQRYGFGCYIGGRLEVAGDCYGTLCFADEKPRARSFTDREEAFVELLVEWVGEEIERREFADELGTTRRELRRTIERIDEGFLSVDDDWVVTSLNERVETLLEADREAAVDGDLWDLFPESAGERFHEEFHRAVRTREPVTFEARHDPLERWFEVRAYPGDDGLSVFFRDVTGRKRRERELRRSRERYRTLAENVPDGAVILVDEDRRFQVVRGGGLSETSIDPEEFEGRRVTEALDELDELAVDLVDRTLDGEAVRTELPLAGSDYQLRTAPVTDEDGDIFAATAVITEVTAIRERERAVRDVYEVIADPERSFDATVESLLSLGCEYLDATYGSLSSIEGEEYRFEAVHAPSDTLEAGDTMPLSATNCERAAATEETVVLSDIEREAPELADRPGNVELGLRCYLGAPVFAGDELHGTFCFYDDEPRAESFSEWERTLVDLMSQWVGYELERGGRERELERYESVLESIRDSIYALDESLRFRLVTEPLAGRLGYEREELSGRPISAVLDPESEAAMEAAVGELLESGGVTSFQGTARTADGGTFPVEVGVSRPEEGAGFVGSMRDITDRRERQRDLEFFYELVAAAGVGITAIDEAGRLEYLNEAGAELLGDPRQRAVGDGIENVLADGAVEGYDSVWERVGFESYDAVWEQVGFEETTVIEATAEGATPVELRLAKETIDGEPHLFGTVVDVTERKEMAEIRRTLSETAGAMLESGDVEETCRRALSAGATITGCTAGVAYLFESDRGTLEPETASGAMAEVDDDLPVLSGGDSLTWQSFVEGRIRAVEDVTGHEAAYADDLPFRGAAFVPFGEHGVFTFASEEPLSMTTERREALEILAANVEGDLDRTSRERALEKRERELEKRTDRLERLNRVNAVVRSIAAVVVQETDREGIKQAVPERLVGVDPFVYAWVGADGPTGPAAEAWAGEATPFDDPGDADDHPAAEAAATGEVQVHQNLMTTPEADRAVWQAAALERGYPACCVVPLTYEGTTRGVLTVYADRPGVFEESLRELLAELGEMIGYALTAAERQAALASERTVELAFEVDDGTLFTRLADRLDCSVELKRARTDGEVTTTTYLLENVDSEALSEVAAALPGGTTASTTTLDNGTALVEVTVGGEWIGSAFAAEGGRVEAASADPDAGQLTARLPLGIDVRPVVEAVQTSFPDVELVAKREREQRGETRSMLRGGVEERLTGKQLEVLETAHLAGFFDQPRRSSGDDVADLLGVSQPTFNQQRRAAERKLVEFLLDER